MNAVEMLRASNGKFVTVTFVKKDGTVRTLNGRLGVVKHLKGGVSNLDPHQYTVVYDVVNKGYRAVNNSTIQSVKCGDKVYT